MKKLILMLVLITAIVNSSCKKDEPAPTTTNNTNNNNNNTNNPPPTPPKPVASFGYTTGECYGPCYINFLNASTNATSYKWDFGDSTTSTEFKPVHNYLRNGVYKVTLTATGGGGTHTIQNNVNVTFVNPPADALVSNFTYEGGQWNPGSSTIIFKNASKNATGYAWEFGDGGTSADENPTHVYTAEGTYNVKLTATGPKGARTIMIPVVVKFYTDMAAILTARRWKFEDVLMNGTRETTFYNALSGSRYIFKNNGEYEEFNIKDPTQVDKGIWGFKDSKTLFVKLGAFTQKQNILELSANKIRLGKTAGNEIIYTPE